MRWRENLKYGYWWFNLIPPASFHDDRLWAEIDWYEGYCEASFGKSSKRSKKKFKSLPDAKAWCKKKATDWAKKILEKLEAL